jgi:hypothetical protein
MLKHFAPTLYRAADQIDMLGLTVRDRLLATRIGNVGVASVSDVVRLARIQSGFFQTVTGRATATIFHNPFLCANFQLQAFVLFRTGVY